MELKSALISLYGRLQNGNAEGTYEEFLQMKQHPDYIQTLLEVIQSEPNNFFKKQASISLKNIINEFSRLEESPLTNEVKEGIGNAIVQILSQEIDYQIQQLLSDAYDDLTLDGNTQLILQFAQNSLEAQNEVLITAAVLLLQTASSEIFDSLDLVMNIISAGIATQHPVPAFELGFTLGSALFRKLVEDNYDEEDLPDPTEQPFYDFFHTLFEQCLTTLIENIGKPEIFQPLLIALNHTLYIEEDDIAVSPFVDGELVYNHFSSLIGNEDILQQVPVETQAALAGSLNLALMNTNLADMIFESELSQTVVDQYFYLAGFIASSNLEDRLALCSIDVFEDFCPCLNIDDDYVQVVLDKAVEVIDEEEYTPAATLALAFCLEGKGDDYVDRLDEIVPLICNVAVSEHQLARDCASKAIKQFADIFEGLLDDYLEPLTEACLQSFQMQDEDDVRTDTIKALTNLFIKTSDTDSVFEQVFEYLNGLMGESTAGMKMELFSCLVSLCSHATKSITAHFDTVYEMMAGIITSEDEETTYLIPSAIECLKSMATKSPSQFMQHVEGYAGALVQMLESDDTDVLVSVLEALGSAASNYSDLFLQHLNELAPKLLSLGEQDTNAKLAEDILQIKKNQQALEENKEITIEFEMKEEDDDSAQKPYRIPSLALCTLCSLLYKAPTEVIAEFAPQIMERLVFQSDGIVEEAIAQTFKATAMLAELVGTHGINLETYTTDFISRASGIIKNKSVNSPLAICSAVEMLEPVLSFFPRESLSDENIHTIVEIVQQFLNGTAPLSIKSNNEQVLEDYSKLIQNLITAFQQTAVENLGEIIPILMELLTSNKPLFKNFSLPIMGCFVEFDGEHMTEDVLTTIYFTAKGLILSKNDPTAVFVINEFVSGAPELLKQDLSEMLQLLTTKINQPAKKAEQYKLFISRIASVLTEFQRQYYGDEFDIAKYLSFILQNTPCIYDESENLGLIRFFVWAANKTGCQPANEFLAAGVRTLMLKDEEIGESLMTDPLFEEFKQILGSMIQALPDQSQLAEICEGDELKFQRVMSFFQ